MHTAARHIQQQQKTSTVRLYIVLAWSRVGPARVTKLCIHVLLLGTAPAAVPRDLRERWLRWPTVAGSPRRSTGAPRRPFWCGSASAISASRPSRTFPHLRFRSDLVFDIFTFDFRNIDDNYVSGREARISVKYDQSSKGSSMILCKTHFNYKINARHF